MIKRNTVGSIIKEAREKNNLTQQELARKAFLTRQSISKYELNISQISVENFLLLLDILGTSVLLENGKIKIMEVKNMNNIGYLKIDAQTAKIIAINTEQIIETFKENGLNLLNLLEVREVLYPNNTNNYASLDKGFYLTVDFSKSTIDKKYIENPFEGDFLKNPLFKLLNIIKKQINVENFTLAYYPASVYEEIQDHKITFKDIDLIKTKMNNFHNIFKPKQYDRIYPNPRAGYQRVKKDGKYGFIDCLTGEEVIPCKFDFVEAFDYKFTNHKGEMICRARLDGKQIIINKNGNTI